MAVNFFATSNLRGIDAQLIQNCIVLIWSRSDLERATLEAGVTQPRTRTIAILGEGATSRQATRKRLPYELGHLHRRETVFLFALIG